MNKAGPCLLLAFSIGAGALRAQSQPGTADFERRVQPFLARNCYGCHNSKLKVGGFDIEALQTAGSVNRDRARWEAIQQKLQLGLMPPKGSPQPDPATITAITGWIQAEFDRADAAMPPNAGRVTARRLNRAEYNNSIRDLLAVDLHSADDFPQDDSGYGFDNIGDVLSLPPVLMEKYLSAAEKISRVALFGPEVPKPVVIRHQPPFRQGLDGGDNSRFLSLITYTITNYDVTGLSLPSALHTMHRFPIDGEYVFRVSPDGNRPRPSDPFQVAIWIDGKQAATIQFEASTLGTGMEGLDRETRVRVPAGDHWVAVSALRIYEGLPAKYKGLNPTTKIETAADNRPFTPAPLPENATPEERALFEQRKAGFANRANRANRPPAITDCSFRVNFVEITGPFNAAPFNKTTGPSRESLRKVFTCGHLDGHHQPSCARKIVTDFERRAYRRPPTLKEVNRVLGLVAQDQKEGDSFDESMAVAIQAVLVSPQFLFRIERNPKSAGKMAPNAGADRFVTQYELASRLSYFLWSSTPDDELLRLADRQSLRQPQVLEAQVERMLKDSKAKALVENFGGQWLQFRALESVKPDPNLFPQFDEYLRMSMRKETEMFFENIIRENRPVTEFLNANYSFLNERLANFYKIKGVSGPEFRKVDLAGTHRGGILTHGSVLTVSSYATRTSVVLRGKYVLENILNAPVPPPPPNVPPLDESAVGTAMSLRQQMEQHRANPLCASCHQRMDPLGFGLENYDAVGGWRTQDGKFPIEASGAMPNGKTFAGPEELMTALSSQPDAFTSGLVDKLLTYALGRGLERSDRPVVQSIARTVAEKDYRFSHMVLQIVDSLPFQKRRGD